MDERVEKAFAVVNYMATLSNQRRIITEESQQKLVHYTNGATFKVTPDLISFTKTVIDLGKVSDIGFIDSNNMPVLIPDVREFFNNITTVYFEAINEYASRYGKIRSKRKVEDIINL